MRAPAKIMALLGFPGGKMTVCRAVMLYNNPTIDPNTCATLSCGTQNCVAAAHCIGGVINPPMSKNSRVQ